LTRETAEAIATTYGRLYPTETVRVLDPIDAAVNELTRRTKAGLCVAGASAERARGQGRA
jgi:hypothetical protein